ncbi:MAG: hypothetical protein IPM23_05830 [Candidatus Melainabacteria bacterium]|nr:hypothetical protein [Candidatus Melainabacteria bacterium]
MVNPVVIFYTLLLQVRKFGKMDILWHVLLLISAAGAASLGPIGIYGILGLVTNPAVLLLVALRFTTDNYQAGNEYYALLFSRPIRRFDYVLTKALAGWLGTQFFAAKILLMLLMMQLLFGTSPLILPEALQILSVSVNALSASCLSLLICKLPDKLSSWALLLLTGSYLAGSTASASLKPEGLLAQVPMQQGEAFFAAIGTVFYPYLDLDSLLNATTFSLSPFLDYISNLLLYLLIAAWLLSRQEFSYAND